MLTELRTKSQITIPKDIVMKMGLREGDKLEIVEKDGVIAGYHAQVDEILSYINTHISENLTLDTFSLRFRLSWRYSTQIR